MPASLVVAVLTVISVELFLRLPILATIGTVSGSARRSFEVIRAKAISDHWKEQVLPAYSGRMMAGTVRLAVLLVLMFTPFILAGILSSLGGGELYAFMTSLPGIALSVVVAMVYGFARRRFVRH
ncbi:hypothetical protein [Parvularcula lutaonensis]|uniref:Uncharacterized protein n=1 Tax=Parvularcula lutaonensis TaxID=491923 RepID=A0ABV7M7X7_9PROT|nr:hypothetical protein [Parvularcula lutaonensis]GGY56926.1 hypothetical protein GCM10007148_28050 [Parvularcula lutaonensis]